MKENTNHFGLTDEEVRRSRAEQKKNFPAARYGFPHRFDAFQKERVFFVAVLFQREFFHPLDRIVGNRGYLHGNPSALP